MGGVVDAVTDVVEEVVNTVVDAVSSVFSAIGSALSGVFGGLAPDVNVPDVNASQSPDGVKVTKNGSNMDIPVVYGFRRVGGKVVFAETNGSSNKYLYVVYVIAEGEVQGVKRILVQDVELPSPGSKYNAGQVYTITSGRYANRLKLQIFNGTESQSQSSLANESSSWSRRTRKMPGVCYCVARYEWKKIETQEDADANPYSGGIPNIQFDVLGKKVYNVINHAGGEDLANDYSGLSKSFSYNPVNCVLDYLMNPRYGCGIDKSEINADAFKTAAIKLNQQVTYATGQTGKAMTMSAVLSTKAKLLDNVKLMLSGARSFMPFIQGRYKIKVEDGGNATDITSATLTSAYDISETELLSDVTLQGEQKANKFNQVIVKYVDPDKEFTEQEVSYTVSADVTADGEDLIGNFEFFSVNNANIAKDIARMIYDKSRNQRYITFTATPELLDVEPGDIIRISSDVLNLTTQTFRVTNITINTNGTVQFEAREHTASVYPFVSGTQIEIPAQTYKPDTYTLTGLVKNTPTTPLGVAPPDDEEDTVTDPTQDSAGQVTASTSPSTTNNQLPEAPDVQATTGVTRFQIGTYGGSTDSALLINAQGYSFPINYDIRQGTVDGVRFIDLIFRFVPPADSTIDTIRFYYYSVSTKLVTKIVDKPINYNIASAQPQQIVLEDMGDDVYILPRFRNSTDNREYKDGSDNRNAGGIAYTNLSDQAVIGYNLEAAINNNLQSNDFELDPDTRFQVHNLGG